MRRPPTKDTMNSDGTTQTFEDDNCDSELEPAAPHNVHIPFGPDRSSVLIVVGERSIGEWEKGSRKNVSELIAGGSARKLLSRDLRVRVSDASRTPSGRQLPESLE